MNVRPARLELMAAVSHARMDSRARTAQEEDNRKKALGARAKQRRREKAEAEALAAKLAAMSPAERSTWHLERLIPRLPVLFSGRFPSDRCVVQHINLRENYANICEISGIWDSERVRSIGGLQIRPQTAMRGGGLQVTIKMLKRILYEMGHTIFNEHE
jgi:hypothetical protein